MSNSQDLELYLKNLNDKMASIEEERSKILGQIHKNKEDEKKAIVEQAITAQDWKTLLRVDENVQTNAPQDEFWTNHLKPVNKLISRAGSYTETKQISFKLSLINSSYNKDQVKKLLPVVEPIIKNLEPIKIHKDIAKRYKVLPIFDQHKGARGSYSLIIDEKGEGAVYCEDRMKPAIVSKFMSIEQALTLIAKKYYHYT